MIWYCGKWSCSTLTILFLSLLRYILWIYFYIIVALRSLSFNQPLFYRLANRVKNLCNVVVILSRTLHERHIILSSQRGALLETNLPLSLLTVNLVANDDFAHTFRLRLVDLLDPIFEVIKGLPVGDGVDKYYSCCSLVIGFCNGFETLLTSSIPDLHFDFDAIDIDCFDFEVYADGGHMRHLILFIDITQQDVGLTDCSVPDDDQLHQVVILFLISSLSHIDYIKTTEIMGSI